MTVCSAGEVSKDMQAVEGKFPVGKEHPIHEAVHCHLPGPVGPHHCEAMTNKPAHMKVLPILLVCLKVESSP